MAQNGWNLLLTRVLVKAAKALRGSFKIAPKTVMEMTQLLSET